VDNDYGKGSGLNKLTDLQPMARRKRNKRNKLIAIALALVVVVFFIVLPIVKIRSHIAPLTTSAKELKYVFSLNDMDQVEAKFDEFSKKYDSFEKDARGIYWLSFIPYVSDFKNGVEAGHYSIAAGKDSITAIAPYADLIGFKKGNSSFSEKSADERLQTAVLTLDKVLGNIDTISENIKQAEMRVQKIDPNHYPESFGKTKIRSQV